MRGASSSTRRPVKKPLPSTGRPFRHPPAVFIGRFQPFHAGHSDAWKQISRQHENRKILVGSSNRSRTRDNPLTFTERKQYLRSVLGERVSIGPLPDTPSDAVWVRTLRRHLSPASTVYSGNDWVLDLCDKARIPARRIVIRKQVSATEIRSMIRAGQSGYLRFLARPRLSGKLLRIIRETNR